MAFFIYTLQTLFVIFFYAIGRKPTDISSGRHPQHQMPHKCFAGLWVMGSGMREGLGYEPPVASLTR